MPASIFEILTSPGPYHVVLYGLWIGGQFYQSFIGGIISYRALPLPQFSQLQQRIFPVYFTLQTLLPPLLLLTSPVLYAPHPTSPHSLLTTVSPLTPKTTFILLGISFLTSAANLLYLGPLTGKIMKERKRQETIDGKPMTCPKEEASPEMRKLNKRFAKVHGLSAGLNLVGMLAGIGYGLLLGGRLH